MDTIFALASGQLPAGIAVMRVSGVRAFEIATALVGPLPPARTTSLRTIRSRNGETLDKGLVVCFSAMHSFTGEDVVEFHLHGSRAVVRAISNELQSFEGVRQAEAGEFTQRAFVNGKFDLTMAEGLASLIDAETEAQRQYALRQSSGESFELYEAWQDELLRLRALSEAEIDFSDEDGVDDGVASRIGADALTLACAIQAQVSMLNGSRVIRDGALVVLAGRPNAGKSSLFNALLGDERVIVSPMPGTTRDYVEARLDLNGLLVRLVDTAGLRESNDEVESAGIARSHAQIREADVVVGLVTDRDDIETLSFDTSASVLVFLSKADTQPAEDAVSIFDLDSVERLRRAIERAVRKQVEDSLKSAPVNERHVSYLSACVSALEECGNSDLDPGVRGDRLRAASHALGRIVGNFGTEEVLGAIFSRFCIGK